MKTFGLSKFLFVSSMISTPLTIQRQINSIIHQFIWNGPDKIKRSVIRSNYDKGGLKMMDIYSRIKARHIMWVKRFFDENRAGWKHIFNQYLSRVGGMTLLLKCNVDMNQFNVHVPHFYVEILKTCST